jgi:hypothetical protein
MKFTYRPIKLHFGNKLNGFICPYLVPKWLKCYWYEKAILSCMNPKTYYSYNQYNSYRVN